MQCAPFLYYKDDIHKKGVCVQRGSYLSLELSNAQFQCGNFVGVFLPLRFQTHYLLVHSRLGEERGRAVGEEVEM